MSRYVDNGHNVNGTVYVNSVIYREVIHCIAVFYTLLSSSYVEVHLQREKWKKKDKSLLKILRVSNNNAKTFQNKHRTM